MIPEHRPKGKPSTGTIILRHIYYHTYKNNVYHQRKKKCIDNGIFGCHIICLFCGLWLSNIRELKRVRVLRPGLESRTKFWYVFAFLRQNQPVEILTASNHCFQTVNSKHFTCFPKNIVGIIAIFGIESQKNVENFLFYRPVSLSIWNS